MIAYRSYKVIGKKIEEFVVKEENGNIIQRATIPRRLSTSEDIVIPDYITDISSFSSCMYKANAIVSDMRGYADYFGNVILHNNITNMQYAFANMIYFNRPITIPNSVTDCGGLLYGCTNFNQPITIPNGVTDCSFMFYNCRNFRPSLIIPNSVTDCSYMFSYCDLNNSSMLTQNFFNDLGNHCINASYMLSHSNINGSRFGLFNYYIWFRMLNNGAGLFYNCINADLSSLGIIFNKEINNLCEAFGNVARPPRNIWVRGKNIYNVGGMLRNKNNSHRVNIWFDGAKQTLFRNALRGKSLTGNPIVYTNMTNGFYNTTYNIYCYNNYNSFS